MSYGTVQAEKMTTESGYSLGAGNASSFKNRIINGQVQIWQRGTSFTVPTSDGYTADRWQSLTNGSGGTITVSQGTTNLPPNKNFSSKLIFAQSSANRTGATAYAARQLIEMANIYDAYAGGVWTVSFWYRTNRTGTNYIRLGNDQGGGSSGGAQPTVGFTVNSADTWEFKTVPVTLPALTTLPTAAINTVGGFVDIGFTVGGTGPSTINSGDYFEFTGFQLEVGTVATSFDFRPYPTELAMCQRYYYRISNTGDATSIPFGLAYTRANNACRPFINFPVQMRVRPTGVETSGTASHYSVYYAGDAVATCNAVPDFDISSRETALLGATVGGTPFPSGGVCYLRSNSTSAYLGFSAEL